ncbi:fimbrial protein [Pseudomonas aeruginosa]|uniref:fimbrial protein n=1 Tax=Pseudomonas aeruginosa TaxID=287 RepID=UPI000F525BEB|nr:fimbrial protein [Pseudomonas aeruginosa]RQC55886.1 hypothetical protein IPC358_21670 [Pseudomonas aeruginosa]RQF50950.1 hypothetical protein IPC274_22965 [Pseudomonas aeruginosa]RQI29683.1 hypothetical protein IPC20_19285 [Pseudomonas aeruginosa]
MIQINSKTSFKSRVLALFSWLLLPLSDDVLAGCDWIQGGTITLNTPSTLTASSEAPLLSPLSDWVENTYFPLWNCSTLWNSLTVGTFLLTNATATGQKYDGLTVYRTSTPSVGFVAKKQILAGSYNSDWLPMTTREDGNLVPSPAAVGFSIKVRLIKTGPILPGTQLKKTEIAQANAYAGLIKDKIANISIGPIDFIVPTCKTGNIDVNLGEVYMGRFKGVGSEAGSRNFDITLESCPGGFKAITYRLDPINEIIDAGKGIISIDKEKESASGIAVRVTGRDSTLKLGSEQQLSTYTGVGGTYNIPFTASYYQTGPITPGTANASLEFIINYQ